MLLPASAEKRSRQRREKLRSTAKRSTGIERFTSTQESRETVKTKRTVKTKARRGS